MTDYWAIDNNVLPTWLIMLAGIGVEVLLLYLLNNREHLRACFGPTGSFDEAAASGAEELAALGIKEDDDVVAERERCLASSRQRHRREDHDLLCTRGLAKQFVSGGGLCSFAEQSAFVAVRNSSFGVDRGDVLGLLGPNGAGKTTTISMITGW